VTEPTHKYQLAVKFHITLALLINLIVSEATSILQSAEISVSSKYKEG